MNTPMKQEPTGQPTPKLHLSSISAVRREMARVYRDTRRGRIPTSEGTRLTYMLRELARTMELEMLPASAVMAAVKVAHGHLELGQVDGWLARLAHCSGPSADSEVVNAIPQAKETENAG